MAVPVQTNCTDLLELAIQLNANIGVMTKKKPEEAGVFRAHGTARRWKTRTKWE